jgi:predicted ester cyclase
LPDFRMEVLDLVATGEKVAVRWHLTGTFDGEAKFEGAIATGAKIEISGCDVLTVRDGKIQRNDAYLNGMQMARQLGVLPAQGSGQERAMIAATNVKTRLARRLGRR